MAEDGGGKETRPYRIFKAAVFDPNEPQAFVTTIKELYGDDFDDRVDVMIVVGRAVESLPNKALERVGEMKPSITGDFDVAADSSFTTYPIEVETQPRVKVGPAKK